MQDQKDENAYTYARSARASWSARPDRAAPDVDADGQQCQVVLKNVQKQADCEVRRELMCEGPEETWRKEIEARGLGLGASTPRRINI
jgi:hypothetical protein